MTKILMLVTQPLDPDPRIYREARSLTRHGYRLRIVGLALPGETGYEERHSEISDFATKMHLNCQSRIFQFAWNGWSYAVAKQLKFNLECFRNIRRLLKGVSVIHCNDADTLPMGWFLSRLSGARLVYDAHEHYAGMFSENVPTVITHLVGLMEKTLARKASALLTTGDMMSLRMQKMTNRKPVKLRNVPYLDFGKGVKRQTPNKFTIGYLGALRKGRNIMELIDGFIAFNSKNPKSHLLIAGWGLLSTEISNIARNSNGTISFLGKIPGNEVPSILAKLSIAVIFTSKSRLNHYYASSNKLFEAVAMGVPVLVTDIGELAHIVQSNELGFVVDSDNPEAIEGKIAEIYSNREKLKEIERNAASCFKQRFNWDLLEHRLINAYEELLSKPS